MGEYEISEWNEGDPRWSEVVGFFDRHCSGLNVGVVNVTVCISRCRWDEGVCPICDLGYLGLVHC